MKIATIKNFGAFISPNTINSAKKTPQRDVRYFELEYIYSGQGFITIDGNDFTICDNSIAIKKPRQKAHSCFSIKCFFLYIEVPESSEYYDFLMDLPSNIPVIDPLVYSKIFKDLIKHLTSSNSREDDYINSKLLELFYFLGIDKKKNLSNSKISSNSQNKLIIELIRYIDQNFRDKITLETLSKKIGYTPNYLQHIFKTIMGITPQQYIEKTRINRAKYLLTSSYKSLQEISDSCGFDSQSYFSLIFKKHTSFTPSEYRKLSILSYNDH